MESYATTFTRCASEPRPAFKRANNKGPAARRGLFMRAPRLFLQGVFGPIVKHRVAAGVFFIQAGHVAPRIGEGSP